MQISVKLSDTDNRVKAIFVEILCGFKKSMKDQKVPQFFSKDVGKDVAFSGTNHPMSLFMFHPFPNAINSDSFSGLLDPATS